MREALSYQFFWKLGALISFFLTWVLLFQWPVENLITFLTWGLSNHVVLGDSFDWCFVAINSELIFVILLGMYICDVYRL